MNNIPKPPVNNIPTPLTKKRINSLIILCAVAATVILVVVIGVLVYSNSRVVSEDVTHFAVTNNDKVNPIVVDKSDCTIDPNDNEQVGYFSVKSSTREHLSSPLFQAVMDGDATSSIDLLNHGANANEKVAGDDGYYTPLMIASSMGANPIAKCLLKKGADSSIMNRQGRTALMFAAENCNDKVVDTLIEGGADVNAKDKLGKDVLYFAAVCSVSSRQQSYTMVHNLLTHGANPNVVSKSDNLADPKGPGTSALETLASNSNNIAVAEMIRAGATDSKEGLYMKPSESVPYYDKITYDVLVEATSSDIEFIKNSNKSSTSWSTESKEMLGYKDAMAYCKGIDGYRLPTKTELQIAFVNKEPGFKLDVYHTSDLGDGTMWTRDNKGNLWKKEMITKEIMKYYLEQKSTPDGVVNMYNGIYYTVMGKVRTRCIKLEK